MIITNAIQGAVARVALSGRLDAAWADHFLHVVEEIIRDGQHHVRIDASELEYISSAGIRSLLRLRRDLHALNGSLGIVKASAPVENILRMSGLDTLLITEDASEQVAVASFDTESPVPKSLGEEIHFECHPLNPEGRIDIQIHDAWAPWCLVTPNAALEMAFPRTRFGLGIGAAGRDARDAHGRYGEFVAAAGCVGWLPGDGADRPDYLEQAEQFIPRLHVIQALIGEGSFSHLLRFQREAKGGVVTAANLFARVLETVDADAAALVALVEVDGLVGAALARSPGLMRADQHPGGFPEVRDWLTFCGERVYHRAQALVVAFVCRGSHHALAPHVTSLPSQPDISAHAHALVLSYHSLPRGVIELDASVAAVFADSAPLGLLHLLEDDRSVGGLGQSAFIQGACWCAPLNVDKEYTP